MNTLVISITILSQSEYLRQFPAIHVACSHHPDCDHGRFVFLSVVVPSQDEGRTPEFGGREPAIAACHELSHRQVYPSHS